MTVTSIFLSSVPHNYFLINIYPCAGPLGYRSLISTSTVTASENVHSKKKNE